MQPVLFLKWWYFASVHLLSLTKWLLVRVRLNEASNGQTEQLIMLLGRGKLVTCQVLIPSWGCGGTPHFYPRAGPRTVPLNTWQIMWQTSVLSLSFLHLYGPDHWRTMVGMREERLLLLWEGQIVTGHLEKIAGRLGGQSDILPLNGDSMLTSGSEGLCSQII